MNITTIYDGNDVLGIHLRSRSLSLCQKISQSGRLLCNGSINAYSVRYHDPYCVTLIFEI